MPTASGLSVALAGDVFAALEYGIGELITGPEGELNRGAALAVDAGGVYRRVQHEAGTHSPTSATT